MALLSKDNFERKNKDRPQVHGKIPASYTSFFDPVSDKRYFQIDTYGSLGRKMPGKPSQVIQFDEDMAKYLIEILKGEFNL